MRQCAVVVVPKPHSGVLLKYTGGPPPGFWARPTRILEQPAAYSTVSTAPPPPAKLDVFLRELPQNPFGQHHVTNSGSYQYKLQCIQNTRPSKLSRCVPGGYQHVNRQFELKYYSRQPAYNTASSRKNGCIFAGAPAKFIWQHYITSWGRSVCYTGTNCNGLRFSQFEMRII